MQIAKAPATPGANQPSAKASCTNSANADLNGDNQQNWPGCFRHVARCRRLNKEEVVLILSDPLKFGLVRTEVLPSEGISSGTVYLCSKERVRVLKHDGIDYVKRNAAQGSNRIREDVVKMKVNGRHAVNSYSSRGSGSACFWRRRYALEPPAPTNGSSTGTAGSRGRNGQQIVTWGDQLVHYLDDEEARGFARRSPFGAAGVARPLTSEECWRGRGAQLPSDGNLFLPPPRRESSSAAASRRLDEHQALAAAAAAAGAHSSHSQGCAAAVSLPSPTSASEKPLPSLSSVKQEDASPYRGGGGSGGGGGSWRGSITGGGPGSIAQSSSRRFNAGNEVRASTWTPNDIYGMNGNGHTHMGDGGGGGGGVPPGSRLGGSGGGGMPMWDVRKCVETQQSAGLPNPTGFYDDDMSGLEFEGLGMGEVGPGTNGSTDDDMSDLFRSFLVDGEDFPPIGGHSAGSNSHHSGGSAGNHSNGGSQPSSGGPMEPNAPVGFGLRVSGGVGRGDVSRDSDRAMTIRRRGNTSPEVDDLGGGGGNGSQGLRLMDMPFRPISPQSHPQRSQMVLMPALVGSPPRRSESHTNNNSHKHTGGGINSPASRFVPSNHGHVGNGSSSSSSSSHVHGHPSAKVSAAAVAAAAAAVTAPGAESCSPPTSLQLASSWTIDSYSSASSMANNVTSSSPAGGGVVPAAPSPAGMVAGMLGCGGGSVPIVEFCPTWDFAPGGAKLLICLAGPLQADLGGAGPIVFFADRPVQAEVVSRTVLRCRVPPCPGIDGVSRVPLRVEISHGHSSGGMGRLESPATSHAGGRHNNSQGSLEMHVFEYRSPSNSPTSTSSTVSRGGTPVASTPGKKRPWHELPSTEKNGTARKREWGEVSTSSAPSPLEPVYSSPNVCNWAERGRGWGTPRAGEPTPWVGKGGRGSQSASGARRGQPHPWRRASGDFEQVAVLAATRSNEDSLGYPLLPCDGRECKIRIVERLGEIQGSRASSTASEIHGEGGHESFSSAPSGGGSTAPGASAGINASPSGDVPQSSAGAGSTLCESRDGAAVAGGGQGPAGLGGGGGGDLGHHQALDDSALNELGDADLEVLLEEMWMKVMGQLTDLESELNALDTRGFSVLHYTCLHSLGALVPVLLDRGADVNLRTGDGRDQTPLHLAATAGSLPIVQELMKMGANMDAVDAYGLTPDKLAIRCNKREVGLFLWGQTRGAGAGSTSSVAPAASSSPSTSANPNNTTTTTTATTTTPMRQDSPAPVMPWGGGVSPAGCPPSPWSCSTGGGPDNWQGQLSPSPETANEHSPPNSSSTQPGNASPPHPPATTRSPSNGGDSTAAASPSAGASPSATALGMTELEGSGNGGDDPAAPFIGQAGRTWQSTGICGGGGAGRATGAGQGGDAAAGWGMGLPPPGGGRAGHSRVDVDAPPSLDRLEMAPMEDIGNGAEEGGAQGSSGSEGSGCKGTSTEQLLSGAFSTLSLHEKCALSLHVSSLQQQGGQQQGGSSGADPQLSGVDLSELSGILNVLSGEEGVLQASDLRAIMSMMGPSDLSEVEDEVKIIQQNLRAWILRCNYKSLRKAARTLQVAWRERQKCRLAEADLSTPGRGASNGSPLSAHPPSPARSIQRIPSNLTLNGGGPDPMDDGSNEHVYGGGNSIVADVSGGETPPRSSDAGLSDAGGGTAGCRLALGGADGERSAREERAANALQAAARVMLARRGRFQRLARETSALLVIQKKSREWLKQKQSL